MKLIGEIMITLGYVTADHIIAARCRQMKHQEKRLGECLIELGHASEDHIHRALAIQNAIREKETVNAIDSS